MHARSNQVIEHAQHEQKDAASLTKEIRFDNKLKEKIQMKTDERAQELYKVQKKWLSKIKIVAVIIYFLIIPFMETPKWCRDDMNRDDLTPIYHCSEIADGNIPYSQIYKLNPIITGGLDFLCLSFFIFFRLFKSKWRAQSKKATCRTYTLIALAVISFVDTIISIIFVEDSLISNLVRPIVVIIFFSQIRSNIYTAARDLYLSLYVLVLIFIYVFFFSILGYYLFRDMFEREIYFKSISDSMYQMMILLTTANFPDIMLPAYQVSIAYNLYFIIFLLIGLYFFINLLLAKVFDNYK